MKKALIFGAVFLASCTSTSTGVVPIGQDAFMVTHQGGKLAGPWTSSSELKAAALIEVNEYCTKQGKMMKVIDSHQEGSGVGRLPEAGIQFKCISN